MQKDKLKFIFKIKTNKTTLDLKRKYKNFKIYKANYEKRGGHGGAVVQD